MEKNELMVPRYKQMIDYPNAPFPKGTVLVRIPNATNDWYHDGVDEFKMIHQKDIEKCSEVFKPMFWWEDRAVEDMPEYVRVNTDPIYQLPPNCIRKVTAWNRTGDNACFWCDLFPVPIPSYRIGDLKPATPEEYTAYQSLPQ